MNFPDALPTLITERLVLRELEERDVAELFAMFSDPETMRYWSTPPLASLDQALAMLARLRTAFAERSALTWAIASRDDDRAIGRCTLFHWDAQNRRAEIGYILSRSRWGRGFMREALGALLDHAFTRLGLHRVEADIDSRNAASVRALEHFGFAREGLLRERWRVGEEVSDSLLMGLLSRDWEARRSRA